LEGFGVREGKKRQVFVVVVVVWFWQLWGLNSGPALTTWATPPALFGGGFFSG
jgi:hypothetical protein